jgi:hypothetical protein
MCLFVLLKFLQIMGTSFLPRPIESNWVQCFPAFLGQQLLIPIRLLWYALVLDLDWMHVELCGAPKSLFVFQQLLETHVPIHHISYIPNESDRVHFFPVFLGQQLLNLLPLLCSNPMPQFWTRTELRWNFAKLQF